MNMHLEVETPVFSFGQCNAGISATRRVNSFVRLFHAADIKRSAQWKRRAPYLEALVLIDLCFSPTSTAIALFYGLRDGRDVAAI